jgi:hypothetical protein
MIRSGKSSIPTAVPNMTFICAGTFIELGPQTGKAKITFAEVPDLANLHDQEVVFELVGDETAYRRHQLWLFKVTMSKEMGLVAELVCEITGRDTVFVGADGKIQLVSMRPQSLKGQPKNGIWRASRMEPSTSNLENPSYLQYVPTPAGYYDCSVLVPSDTVQPNLLDTLVLKASISNVPTSPKVIHLGGIDLVALKFAYASTDEMSDAVCLFRPSSPEFPRHDHCVVAYPMDKLLGPEAKKIYCCFSTSNQDFNSEVIHVRAIVQKRVASVVVASQSFNFWANEKDATLFSSYGSQDGYVPVLLDHHLLLPGDAGDGKISLGEFCSVWSWQFCISDPSNPNTNWLPIEEVPVNFYVTLDYPGYPWANDQRPQYMPRLENSPVVGLVAIASRAAAGGVSEAEVAGKIMQYLVEKRIFAYSATVLAFTSYSNYSENGIPIGEISIENVKVLESIAGFLGRPIAASCVDISRAVILLTNCIGCNLHVGMIYNGADPGRGFDLNPVLTLGGAKPASNVQFTFHQVAYLGEKFGEGAFIYDPCVEFFGQNGCPQAAMGIPYAEYITKLTSSNFIDSISTVDLRDESIKLL